MRGKALALATLERIRNDPKNWDQTTWRCGTACCFAGHVAMLAGGKWANPEVSDDFDIDTSGIPEFSRPTAGLPFLAEYLLGIDPDDANRLFSAHRNFEELEDLVEKLFPEEESE